MYLGWKIDNLEYRLELVTEEKAKLLDHKFHNTDYQQMLLDCLNNKLVLRDDKEATICDTYRIKL